MMNIMYMKDKNKMMNTTDMMNKMNINMNFMNFMNMDKNVYDDEYDE